MVLVFHQVKAAISAFGFARLAFRAADAVNTNIGACAFVIAGTAMVFVVIQVKAVIAAFVFAGGT